MKTSNYFLLTLFILFFGSFILVGTNPTILKFFTDTGEESRMKTTPLAEFSVVVAEKDSKFTLLVINSDEPCKIDIDEKLMNTIYKPLYEVRQDTLFIKRNPNTMNFPNYSSTISIQCPEIKSFIGKPNSDVTIINPFSKKEQLFLLEHSKLKYQYNGKEFKDAKTELKNGKLVSDYPSSAIKIIANQSEIQFRALKTIIDLDLDMKGSYFYIENNMDNRVLFNTIKGSIKNNSRVDLSLFNTNILKINLKGDKTSTFYRSNFSN